MKTRWAIYYSLLGASSFINFLKVLILFVLYFKNLQHVKIYIPCNFEVNLITHFGVIALFSSNFLNFNTFRLICQRHMSSHFKSTKCKLISIKSTIYTLKIYIILYTRDWQKISYVSLNNKQMCAVKTKLHNCKLHSSSLRDS